jgi:hypothetical protein
MATELRRCGMCRLMKPDGISPATTGAPSSAIAAMRTPPNSLRFRTTSSLRPRLRPKAEVLHNVLLGRGRVFCQAGLDPVFGEGPVAAR